MPRVTEGVTARSNAPWQTRWETLSRDKDREEVWETTAAAAGKKGLSMQMKTSLRREAQTHTEDDYIQVIESVLSSSQVSVWPIDDCEKAATEDFMKLNRGSE